MPIFKPKEGERYKKEEVVFLCSKYIHSSEFQGNVTEKEQKINLIKNKSSELLEFHSRGKGWGSSALNPNCWNEISDVKNPQSKKPIVIKNSKSSGITENNFKQETQYNRRPWGGKYRNDVLRLRKSCAITGCETASLLTASHIKPVIYCTPEEMVDPHNALLLSKVYDKLFDSCQHAK